MGASRRRMRRAAARASRSRCRRRPTPRAEGREGAAEERPGDARGDATAFPRAPETTPAREGTEGLALVPRSAAGPVPEVAFRFH
jgi:hypothetical protein